MWKSSAGNAHNDVGELCPKNRRVRSIGNIKACKGWNFITYYFVNFISKSEPMFGSSGLYMKPKLSNSEIEMVEIGSKLFRL